MTIIAILCSDLHLQHEPPACRAEEPGWYEAMARVLLELKRIQGHYNEVPIIIAGDIFDKWNSPPELINFAIKMMPPNVFVIPGQHDLPNHRYNERRKSAYWTLVASECVTEIPASFPPYLMRVEGYEMMLFPFPWGKKLEKVPRVRENCLRVAVVHDYIWIPGHEHDKAPESSHVSKFEGLQSFDVALFGDNHSHFNVKAGRCHVWNNGTMMRRRSDEKDYKPVVGLLDHTGVVLPHYLDRSRDYFNVVPQREKIEFDFSGVLEELDRLEAVKGSLDFMEVVRLALNLNKAPHSVRRIVQESLQDE